MKQLSQSQPSNSPVLAKIGIATLSGLVIGVVFGVMCGNLPVGILLGLGIGGGCGTAIDQQYRHKTPNIDDLLWAVTPLLIFAVLTFLVALDPKPW